MKCCYTKKYHRIAIFLATMLLMTGIGTHVGSEEINATQIIQYLPVVPQETQDGSCWTNSLVVNRKNVWRCMLENSIYDPCIAIDDKDTIVCGADPVNHEPGFLLNLTEPLPEPDVVSGTQVRNVWLFTLNDGTVCSFATGATTGVDGKRLNYLCSDQSGFLGDLQPGEVWTGEKVIIEMGNDGPFLEESKIVPIKTIWQIADPDVVRKNIGLTTAEISFQYQHIADYAYTTVGQAIPHEPDEPPYLNGMPAHLRVNFDRDTLSRWFDPRERQLFIFPVDKFQTTFKGNSLDEINRHIHTLQTLLSQRPHKIEDEIFIFPTVNAAQDLKAQITYLDFQNGAGIRFIAHYAQEAAPFTNERLFYTFQGLTDDNKYYVAFYCPISASILPDTENDTSIAEDYEAFIKRFKTYKQETVQALDELDPDGYRPTLEQLDAMLQSLQIKI